MAKIYWLLSAVVLLLALGLTLYVLDLSRQAREKRRMAEQQQEAGRQQQYSDLKERRSNLNIDLGSNERAIATFCYPENAKKATPAGAAFDKKECEMLQNHHSQLTREIANNEQEIKDWLAANRGTH